jgi:hypothetical protein
MAAPVVNATYKSFQSDGGNDGKGVTTGTVVAGDYLVLCVGSSSNADVISAPGTGTWEEITVSDNLITTSGGQERAYICKDPASTTAYNCTMTGGRRSAVGHLVRGAIAPPGAGSFLSTVVDVKGSLESVAGSSHAPPALTTTGADRLVLDFPMFRQFNPDVAAWTVPASGMTWTKAPSTDAIGLDGNNNVDLGSGWAVQASAGALSTTAWTNSDTFEPAMIIRVAIIPAAGGGSDITAADVPGAWSWRSGYEATTIAVTVPDVTLGLRWSSANQSGVAASGVVADVPSLGFRWASASGPGVTVGISAQDTPGGWRWISSDGQVTFGIVTGDAPGPGFRLGQSPATGDAATIVPDLDPLGLRWTSTAGAGVSVGITVPDSPSGWSLRESQTAVSVGLVVSDTPNGLRWLSGSSTVTVNESVNVTAADLIQGWYRFGESSSTVIIGVPIDDVITFYAFVTTDRFSGVVVTDHFTAAVL